MLTSVVSSSRSVGAGSFSAGVSAAIRTGSARPVRCWGASATSRDICGRLSFVVGKRSANCGLGKRSSNVSSADCALPRLPCAPSVFAASIPGSGALPH
jgi:hypothetical protein